MDSSLEFLILASDGLWDVVTNEVKRETFRHQKIGSRKAAHLKLSIWLQEAVGMVKPILDSEQAAKRLLAEASQRGSADNITCVVVRFMEQHNGLGRATNDQAS